MCGFICYMRYFRELRSRLALMGWIAVLQIVFLLIKCAAFGCSAYLSNAGSTQKSVYVLHTKHAAIAGSERMNRSLTPEGFGDIIGIWLRGSIVHPRMESRTCLQTTKHLFTIPMRSLCSSAAMQLEIMDIRNSVDSQTAALKALKQF